MKLQPVTLFVVRLIYVLIYIVCLYIFQSLINANQFYREVNKWYGIILHSTVRYMEITLVSFYRRVISFRIRIYYSKLCNEVNTVATYVCL